MKNKNKEQLSISGKTSESGADQTAKILALGKSTCQVITALSVFIVCVKDFI